MSGFDLNAKMIQKPFENEFEKFIWKKKRNFFLFSLPPSLSARWPFSSAPARQPSRTPCSFPLLLFFSCAGPA